MSLRKLISQWRGDDTSVAFYNLHEHIRRMGRWPDVRSLHKASGPHYMMLYAQTDPSYPTGQKPWVDLHVSADTRGTYSINLTLDNGIKVELRSSFQDQPEVFPNLQLSEAREKVDEFLKEFSPDFTKHILGKLSTTPTDIVLDRGSRTPSPLYEWAGTPDSRFLLRKSVWPSDPGSYIYDGIWDKDDLPGFNFQKT